VCISVTSTSVIGNYADVTLYEELSGYCCEIALVFWSDVQFVDVVMM